MQRAERHKSQLPIPQSDSRYVHQSVHGYRERLRHSDYIQLLATIGQGSAPRPFEGHWKRGEVHIPAEVVEWDFRRLQSRTVKGRTQYQQLVSDFSSPLDAGQCANLLDGLEARLSIDPQYGAHLQKLMQQLVQQNPLHRIGYRSKDGKFGVDWRIVHDDMHFIIQQGGIPDMQDEAVKNRLKGIHYTHQHSLKGLVEGRVREEEMELMSQLAHYADISISTFRVKWANDAGGEDESKPGQR